MESGMNDTLHVRLVRQFEEAEQSSYSAHEVARRCENYNSGEQLSAEEQVELSRRGQPAIVINLIRKEVNWMRGYEIQQRVDPRAFPRSPNHDQDAEVATDTLRYVADATKYDKIRSKVWSGLVVSGLAGVEVIHETKPPMREPKIKINRYDWDRLFADPHSSEEDFSDARYKGAVVWSDMDVLKEQYPDKDDVIEASLGPAQTTTDAFEDKPYYTVWSDPKRRRCRVVMMYYLERGNWKWAKFTKGGILEEGESPYMDENGESVCPLIIYSMYKDIDNCWHGVVKDYLDPQDEVNKRRSKLLHQMTSRQTWGPKGAVESVAAMKRELAKPDGHVEITKEAILDAAEAGVSPFNIIANADHASGQFQLYQESKNNIEVMGANSALMGNASGNSGRAILAEQQGGLVEIAPLYSRLLDFDNEVYSHIWMRVRQLWTAEKWVRVTDDDRATRFVGLNQPVTLRDALMNYPPEEVQAFARRIALTPNDPRLDQVVGMANEVAKMDVDIVIDEVPDTVTLQGETFEQLINLATSFPGSVPPEILIEAAPNLDRKVKERLLERMEAQQQQQSQVAQGQMKIQDQAAQAKTQRDNAAAQKDMATAQKTAMEAQVAPYVV